MKPLLFFITVFIFVLLFLSSYLPIPLSSHQPLARAASQTITITATVDKHLTYLKNDKNLTISTNSSSGLVLLTSTKTLQFSGASIKSFKLDKNPFILLSNF